MKTTAEGKTAANKSCPFGSKGTKETRTDSQVLYGPDGWELGGGGYPPGAAR